MNVKVADILTIKGGNGAVIEYFGEGVDPISCSDLSFDGKDHFANFPASDAYNYDCHVHVVRRQGPNLL